MRLLCAVLFLLGPVPFSVATAPFGLSLSMAAQAATPVKATPAKVKAPRAESAAAKREEPAAPPAETAPGTAASPGPVEQSLAPAKESLDVASLPPGLTLVQNPAFPPLEPVVSAKPRPRDQGPAFDAASLAPYFGDGDLAKAKVAYDAGEYKEALGLLENAGDANAIRYLRALSRQRSGDIEAAAEAFEALAVDFQALRHRCEIHAGLAREALGQLDKARALYLKIPSTSRLYPDARFGLFRVSRRTRDWDAAVDALTPLLAFSPEVFEADVAADALASLADLAKTRNDTASERAYLFQLWSEHPLSGLADEAAKRLRGVPVPIEVKVARGESLIDANRNLPGLKVLKPLMPTLKLPSPLACRAYFVYGKGLRKMREHTRAEAELRKVVAQCPDDALKPRAMYVLGSSQSIIDQPNGVKTYEALAEKFPQHPFADDALFFAADLDVKLGHPERALQRLETLADRYPEGDFASEALFKSFWIARSLDRKKEAMGVLDLIERRYASAAESYDVERERYWRARMIEAEDPKGAEAILVRLAKEHPATYYGLIARQRLGEKGSKQLADVGAPAEVASADGDIWPLHPGPLAKDPHFQAGIALYRLGFPDAAVPELLAADRTAATDEGIRLLVWTIAQAGDARNAHQLARVSMRRDLGSKVTPSTRTFWEIAYPPAFRELVESSCESAQVDPDLLQALMREESALDPKVISWAGAIGLTQLMLPTARAVAHQLHLRRPTMSALQDPALNLKLGAAYLGRLLARFDGNPFYALASYNAGPGAVNAWRQAHPGIEVDEWVEEIPIAETRGYVKRVLRSYNTYHLLYPEKVDAPNAEGLPVR